MTLTLTTPGVGQTFFNMVTDGGADPTGATDSTTAISTGFDTAHSLGIPALFPAGATFLCGQITKAYAPSLVTPGSQWATIYAAASYTTGNALWTFDGSLATSTSLLANAAQGDFQINVTTAGYSVGDYILLADNTAPYSGQATRFQGQTTRIYSIDDSTHMTLTDPVYAPLTATPFIQKLNGFTGGVVHGLRFYNPFSSSLVSALRISYGIDLDLDYATEGWGGAGCQLRGVYDFRVRLSAKNHYDNAITGLQQFGYGVSCGPGCDHGDVYVLADRVRHAFTSGGEDGAYGEPQNIRVNGVAHGTTSSSWDAHAQGNNITFDNCQAYGARAYGFQLRCKGAQIKGGRVALCQGGVWVFENGQQLDVSDLTIEKVLLDATHDTSGVPGTAFRIQVDPVGSSFRDNRMENVAGTGYRFSTTATDVEIQGGLIRNVGLAAVSGEKNGIRLLGGATRTRIGGGLIIADNQGTKTTLNAFESDAANTDLLVDGLYVLNGINPFSTGAAGDATTRKGRNFISSSTGLAASDARLTVTFSATPTFDASMGKYQTMTLTANVTSSTISNPVDGQELVLELIQDATGGRTFAWPANVKTPAGFTFTTTPSTRGFYALRYDGGATNWYMTSVSQGM